MNKWIKYTIVCLFLLTSIYLLEQRVFAENKLAFFNRDISYDVYYEIGEFEIDCVENVKVVGTVSIDSVTFLIINSSDIKAKEGYIILSSIKAILPSGSIKPFRTFDIKKQ